MAARMAEQGVDHLWLDATGLERFPARFPTIAASLSSIGLDPEHDWLPIAPAAHHLSGGVVTDLWGATALPGLWAVGEVACTGVHGANRLASNSLLEGMVFGARLAERIPSGAEGPEPSGALRAVLGDEPIDGIGCTAVGRRPAASGPGADRLTGPDVTKLRDTLQRAMTRGAGVVRTAESLDGARAVVDDMAALLGDPAASVGAGELSNLLDLADALLVSAGTRTESRGAHLAARVPRDRSVVAPPARPRAGPGRRCGPSVSESEAEKAYAQAVGEAVERALAEDLGPEGDLTAALVPPEMKARFALRARHNGVLAGRDCATEAFRRVDPALELVWHAVDGSEVSAGETVLEVTGRLPPILTAERTALNFLGRLSGIATLTARFVAAAHESNPSVEVLDTRKTTPGLRVLEKAAVRAGGGTSHRAGLSDAVLLKDNHLAGTSITDGGAPSPGVVAGAPGRDRVRCPEPGGRGRPCRCRRRAARQHGPRDRRGGHRRGPPRRAGARPDRGLGWGDPRHRRRLCRRRAGPDLGRGPDPLGPRARPGARPRLDRRGRDDGSGRGNGPTHRARGLRVLLVIDVGNTETVIGLYRRDDTETVPVIEESVGVGIGTEHDPTAPRGLTHHWRLSTVPSRTPDEHAVLLTQLLDLEGLDIATSVTGIAVSSSVPHVTTELRQMATRWFADGALRGPRAGHQERDAHPLRQPQGGRGRPHRRRGGGLRPLRGALHRGRHGHRDDGGGDQRQG